MTSASATPTASSSSCAPTPLSVSPPPSTTTREIGRSLRLGLVAGGVLVFGVGGWAVATDISGAVAAPGILVVESDVKTVQHPTGGVVRDLRVREGDRVRAGDVLLRLDRTVTHANLAVIDLALVELSARKARNEAERDGSKTVAFPADLRARAASDPAIAAVLRDEDRLFASRKAARDGRKAQLTERVRQLEQETRGLAEQVKAKDAETALIRKELQGVRTLWDKGLTPIMRLTALERDIVRVEGQRGALEASIAQAQGRIGETRLQILQIQQDLSAELGTDLADIRARTAELTEKRVAAEGELQQVEIRAPQDGAVHQLSVHTLGGVIAPGEPILRIVPDDDTLTVEARVAPEEIDRIGMGQTAILRFTAFNQRTTPELAGAVSRIAADVSTDPRSGAPFYTVRIALPDSERARLKDQTLRPGMPVEGYLQTGERTVASYLTKPIQDHLARAWREQ